MDVSLKFRGSNSELLEYDGLEVCTCGPAGTGKTVAALYKMHLSAMKYPGFAGILIRDTHTDLKASTLKTFDNQVIPEAKSSGVVEWYGGSGSEAAAYKYSNGSRIYVSGADNPERFLSMELDRIFVDEAVQLDYDVYETLLSRLRGHADCYKQIILATNPGHPTHWIKQREAQGKLRILTSLHKDNPGYFDDEGNPTKVGETYLKTLENLSGARRERLLYGRWTGAEGAVFSEFQHDVHVIPKAFIPSDWPRVWAIDFGYTNPFVCQFWAIDPDGRMVMYREIYMSQRTTEEHAQAILDEVTSATNPLLWIEPKPMAIITDHDPEARKVFTKATGLSTVKAMKNVSVGIQAVNQRLKIQGDGLPRLFIMQDARVEIDPRMLDKKKPTSTLEEIPAYVWDKEKEAPVKENDHGCDDMRYAVCYVDKVGKSQGITGVSSW